MGLLRRRVAGAVGVALLAAEQYDTHYRHNCFNRSARTVWTALATVYDYKVVYARDPTKLGQLHARTAQRWFDCCTRNGGLYIKLGQSIATMNHVLPPAVVLQFSQLQDRAPTVPFSTVCDIFKSELGQLPEELFCSFDPDAIASASIAQVHKAVLKDGSEVAVKVQKPNIEYQLPWDLACYRVLVFAFEKLFDLPAYWTVDEVVENITEEADFRLEAQNTIRAREDLVGHVHKVYVPRVHDDVLTKKLLCTEWIDGVKSDDRAGLQRLGFDIRDVLTTFVGAFAYQTFVTGFVHGDPHPGNVLVRASKQRPSEFEVVILDHGLYIQESEAFRRQYCALWKAMVLVDLPRLRALCVDWGIRDPELFASFQLFRPFAPENRAVTAHKPTREETLSLQIAAKERVKSLLHNQELVPKELIILGRSMNIVRANNKVLGSPVNRVNIMAEFAGLGSTIRHSDSTTRRKNDRSTLVSTPLARYEVFVFRFQLFLISLVYHAVQLRNRIHTLLGWQDASFEQLLEESMKQTVEAKLGLSVSFDA